MQLELHSTSISSPLPPYIVLQANAVGTRANMDIDHDPETALCQGRDHKRRACETHNEERSPNKRRRAKFESASPVSAAPSTSSVASRLRRDAPATSTFESPATLHRRSPSCTPSVASMAESSNGLSEEEDGRSATESLSRIPYDACFGRVRVL